MTRSPRTTLYEVHLPKSDVGKFQTFQNMMHCSFLSVSLQGFFFNPDAGRNAPTLPPEWGRGPGMAAVDPLVAYDPNAPLLQERLFPSCLFGPGPVIVCNSLPCQQASVL